MSISEPVLVAMVTGACAAVPIIFGQIANLVVSMRNGRKVDEVKAATDGMKDALVRVTKSDATQKGHTQGVKDQKAATAKRTRKPTNSRSAK